MLKKIASIGAGASLLMLGVVPAFAQTTAPATPEVEIADVLTLNIDSGASPYDTGGNKYSLQFTEAEANCARAGDNLVTGGGTTVTTDFRGYTTGLTGFNVTFESDTTDGELTSTSDTISNIGGGANLSTAAGAFEMANSTAARGYGVTVLNVGTDADYRFDGTTTIAAKYHGGVAGASGDNDTNTDFYHLDETAHKAIETPDSSDGVDPDDGQAFIVDHIVCAGPGENDLTDPDFTLTLTATIIANP